MGVTRGSLLFSVLISSLLSLLPRDCSSQRPTTGVLLFLENEIDSESGETVPNNTLISVDRLSFQYGLACFSADDRTNTIGQWRFPDGRRIDRDIGDQQQLVFAHNQIARVTLQVRDNSQPFPSDLEGVYSCLIPDENGTEMTLYAGVYSSTTFDNSAGPVLASPVEFHLLSHVYDYPPTFSINCISTAFPPTALEWRLNGSPLDLSNTSFSSSQQLRDAVTSTYHNILTVSDAIVGLYSCSVSNNRGTNSANITVKAPSGGPMIVNISSIGNNSVRVRWTPPSPASVVRGYRVFYTASSELNSNTLTVGDASTAVAHNLTLGVQYSFTVQAFADFSSPNSTETTIMLNAPSPPQSVTVRTLSSSTLQVMWSPSASEVDGYEVSYSPVEGTSCDGVLGGAVIVEGGSTSTYTLRNLEAFTEYSITVRSRSSDGLGPTSTAQTGRTSADVAGPPQMVSVRNGSSSGGPIRVSWTEPKCSDINGPQVTGYKIRYGILSEVQRTITPTSTSDSTFTIGEDSAQLFTEYSIEVAAVNSRGVGQYSQPKAGVITGVPGPVSSLSTDPDILSVVLHWGHPEQGGGYVTRYEIRNRLGTSLLGIRSVGGDLTAYRVRGLQPDVNYQFDIRPFIDSLSGPAELVTAQTQVIRQVQGISVRQLNNSAVNVSWSRFESEDIFYRVYYSSPDGQADFNGNSSWGIISNLQQGQTQFQVAAVVNIQGIDSEGPTSATVCLDSEGLKCEVIYIGSANHIPVIAGTTLGALLLLLSLSAVIAIFARSIFYKRAKGCHKDIETVKCEAYECVKTPGNITQMEQDFEIMDPVHKSTSKVKDHQKENVEMVECEAYKAVKISGSISQVEGDYETCTRLNL